MLGTSEIQGALHLLNKATAEMRLIIFIVLYHYLLLIPLFLVIMRWGTAGAAINIPSAETQSCPVISLSKLGLVKIWLSR